MFPKIGWLFSRWLAIGTSNGLPGTYTKHTIRVTISIRIFCFQSVSFYNKDIQNYNGRLKKIKSDCWSLGINNIVCVFQDFSDMLIDASIQHVCQRANETCCETDGWMVGEGEYLAVDSHHNIKHMNKWIVFIGILIFNNFSNTVWVYLRLLM